MIFHIKEPIWSTNSVGLDHEKLEDENWVYIDYKNRRGQLYDPHIYYITGEKADTYPLQYVDHGVTVHIIPLEEMDKLEQLSPL